MSGVVVMVLDIETSGFSPTKNHIIEICIRCRGNFFHSYINNPDIKWNPETLKWHQERVPDILERIKNADPLPVMRNKFKEFLKKCNISYEVLKENCKFVAHNGKRFDFEFLKKDEFFSKALPTNYNNVFDTLEYSRGCEELKDAESKSLSKLAEFLGVEVDEEKLHGAFYDVELLYLVYKKLVELKKNGTA